MIDWIFTTLRAHPEIAIFLTLGLGFLIGRLQFGSFSLGAVTSTLLAGVLVGQIGIQISPHVKSTFFLMFLFAVGYAVGPQFFRGLKGDGLRQVLFATLVCLIVLATAVGTGMLLNYNAGATAGLLSGAATISAVLGVAGDSINQLSLSADEKQVLLDAMPIAYAITYLFGTAGTAWILANVGPKLLGVDIAEESRKVEAEMGGMASQANLSAYRELTVRGIRLKQSRWIGKTVGELEQSFAARTFVERIRRGASIEEAAHDLVLQSDDVIALSGRRSAMLERIGELGVEVDDRELLDVEIQLLDVVVTSRKLEGKTLGDLVRNELAQVGRGVFARKLIRAGVAMPLALNLRIERGDTLTLVGGRSSVERLAAEIGYADRATDQTNMVVMGLGIAAGALIGAITVSVGGLPLGISTSGGALIAGLACGWARSVNRRFGRIPVPAIWLFNHLGLTAFIAVVGIGAGPSFVAGLMNNGLSLLLAGLIVTTVPLVLGVFAGKYLFRMKPPLILGAVAGARTSTVALGSIAAVAKSDVAALGYSVPYAVGVMLLTIWGVVVVALMT